MWTFLLTSALAAPDIDEPLRTGARSPHDAAVVIGIEQYFALPPVPYADRDAELMEDLFVYTMGVPFDRVQRLGKEASKEQILAAVEEAAKLVGSAGTLWLYYAGHGAASPSTGERLLLGVDTMAHAASFEARAVPVSSLKEATADVHRTVLMVDACYAGASRAGDQLLAGARWTVPAYVKPEGGGWVEWNAAQPNELSMPIETIEHGAFTFAVAGALRGWADGQLNGEADGTITLEEAQLFVRKVLRTVDIREQRPELAAADMQDALTTLPIDALEAAPPPEVLQALARGAQAPAPPPPSEDASPAYDDVDPGSEDPQEPSPLPIASLAQPSQSADDESPAISVREAVTALPDKVLVGMDGVSIWADYWCRPEQTAPTDMRSWWRELGMLNRALWSCGSRTGRKADLTRFPSTGKTVEQLITDTFLSSTTRAPSDLPLSLRELRWQLPRDYRGSQPLDITDASTFPTAPITTTRGEQLATLVPVEVRRGKKPWVYGPWLVVEDDRSPETFLSCQTVQVTLKASIEKCSELLGAMLDDADEAPGVVR